MKTKVKKLIEPCSHFKRSNTRTLCSPFEKFSYKREVRKKELDKKTGRIINVVSYEEVDRYKDMKDYRVSDFGLENLLAINANLTPSQLSMSPLSQAEHIADVLKSHLENSNF